MIFIDTGAFLGRYLRRDQYHERAATAWHSLADRQLFTSHLVLSEAITLLGRRANYRFAAERGREIYKYPLLTVLQPTREQTLQAMDMMEKYADQAVSFADCVSMTLMKVNRIEKVFGFDHHFEIAGFTLWPSL